MAGEQNDSAKADSNDGLSAAADRLREAARWLIASSGAVAAVIFAGISVSTIGDLRPDTPGYRLTVAIAGAGLAVLGALAALVAAISLAAASTVTADDLLDEPRRWQLPLAAARDATSKDPNLAPWGHNFAEFTVECEAAHAEFHERLDMWVEDHAVEANRTWVDRNASRRDVLDGILQALLSQASFLRLQSSFRIGRWIIAASLFIAAVGAFGFVWATSGTTPHSVPTQETLGTWHVPPDAQAAVAQQLGVGCHPDFAGLPVVILDVTGSGDNQQADIVTTGSSSCHPLHTKVALSDVRREPTPTPTSETPPTGPATTNTTNPTPGSTATSSTTSVHGPPHDGNALPRQLLGPVASGLVSGFVQAVTAQTIGGIASTPDRLQGLLFDAADAAAKALASSLVETVTKQLGITPDPSRSPDTTFVNQVNLQLDQAFVDQIVIKPPHDEAFLLPLADQLADRFSSIVATQLARLPGDQLPPGASNTASVLAKVRDLVEETVAATLPPTD